MVVVEPLSRHPRHVAFVAALVWREFWAGVPDGMTEAESKPLIDYLNRHATRAEFLYRHQWRKNDILVWDNRCTLHQALGDFDETQLRHMERTTVLGTPSGYVVAEG